MEKEINITVNTAEHYDFSLQVRNEKGVDIREGMYGLFFEDINYSADGGLYAEMIENRSFEAMEGDGEGNVTYDGLYGWSEYPTGGTSNLELCSEGGLNSSNTHYLHMADGTMLKNQAYDGVYMQEGKKYNVSAFIRKHSTDTARVTIRVYSGGDTAAEAVLAETVTEDWERYEVTVIPTKTVRRADFVVCAEGDIDIDMISCMPSDAIYGIFRADLAERLKAIRPGFLRFPGGCIIEGYNIENRYIWKDTLGKPEERKQNWSRWSAHTSNGLDNGFKHYNQTYGLGYYEYFLLCEYLECDAVPVVNVGLACEYQSSETVPMYKDDKKTYTDEFYSYILDTLDLIEFANGGSDTRWGRIRSDMGHEEPFGLELIGIGNEQWEKDDNQWYERYEAFEREIHKVYPNMKLISTSGPSADGDDFTNAWAWIRNAAKTNDAFTYAVDEHYYMSPEWFFENDARYDNYDRSVKVFAGEYAAHSTLVTEGIERNNLEAALSEAAFMTGIERNADVVYMASYAPLLARVDHAQWAPDMIWFDDKESCVTPTYYVQSMYSLNNGSFTLKNTVSHAEKRIYNTAAFDEKTGDVIIKLVNPHEQAMTGKIELEGFELSGKADITVLAGKSSMDANTLSEPDNIAPKTNKTELVSGTCQTLPALSFTVIRVHTR